jgi:predicted RNase H-like nuclease (RuvC/YqgF family)
MTDTDNNHYKIDFTEYDKLYVDIKKVLTQQEPKLAQILTDIINEERNLSNSKLKSAEERFMATVKDIDELVAHLEESDTTIASLKEDVLNKDVIIDNLELNVKELSEIRDK